MPNLIEMLNILINNFDNESKMINALMMSMTQRIDQFLPSVFTDFILMLALYEKKTKQVNLSHFSFFLKELILKTSHCNVKLFLPEQLANTFIAAASLKMTDNMFITELIKVQDL